MPPYVDDHALEAFVARVCKTNDEASTIGTAVWVAHTWALTCAHVVEGLDQVWLLPGDGGTPELADVRARSQKRDPAAPSQFWPYPDLALLQTAGTNHPVAPLHVRKPGRLAHELHAWGYGLREDNVTPTGSPVQPTLAGHDGEGWLNLSSGFVDKGLSGAPLVDPQGRRIAGLVTMKRAAPGPSGGWAVPADALTELGAMGSAVAALNLQQAWCHREAWARVLPIDESEASRALELLDRFDPETLPAEWLLLPEAAAVDYQDLGDGLLDDLTKWCRAQDGFAVRIVERVGGAGKTRLGIELCRRMHDSGWIAGFLKADATAVTETRLPRLAVIDYAKERDTNVLADQLDTLRLASDPLWPVRVLLIGRPRPTGTLAGRLKALGLKAHGVTRAVTAAQVLATLAPDAAGALYRAARERFGQHPEAQHPADGEPDWPQLGLTALDVLAVAHVDVFGGEPGPVETALERLAEHEQRRWADSFPSLTLQQLRYAVAMLTLAGARTVEEEERIAEQVASVGVTPSAWPDLRTWLATLTPGEGLFPLRPDRLGELIISAVLHDVEVDATPAVTALLGEGSPRQVERVLEVLLRMWKPHDERHHDVTATAFTAALPSLRPRLEGDGMPEGVYALLGRVATLVVESGKVPANSETAWAHALVAAGRVALSRGLPEAAEMLGRLTLALTDPSMGRRPAQLHAGGLTLLGDLARDSGDPTTADTWYRKALTIYEDLANRYGDHNPQTRRDPAVIYERLGNLARDSGDPTTAGTWYRKSLTIREDLANRYGDHNPQTRRDPAIIYERLGDLARDSGDPTTAGTWYRKALTIYEDLANRYGDHNPQTRRDLALIRFRIESLPQDSDET